MRFSPHFLRGCILFLAQHLPGRDESGWKVPEKVWLVYLESRLEKGTIARQELDDTMNPPAYEDIPIPVKVKAVPRLRMDVRALNEFFLSTKVPKVLVRALSVFLMLYGFADASGKGFGSTISEAHGIRYRIGLWEKDAEDETSNWKEFENAVESLEKEAENGGLEGSIVFLCTDNSTVESALYKGNSTSPKLFDLVIRLRKLEM